MLFRYRLDAGTFGTLGVGLGFATAAAALARGQGVAQRVVCVEGDSAFGFSGMEVETMCRSLPFVLHLCFEGKGRDICHTQIVINSKFNIVCPEGDWAGLSECHLTETHHREPHDESGLVLSESAYRQKPLSCYLCEKDHFQVATAQE